MAKKKINKFEFLSKAKSIDKRWERNKTETTIDLPLPRIVKDSDREIIADRVIDFIYQRTIAGQNVYGRRWTGKAGVYCRSHAKKKGYASPVDLEHYGDMLASLKYFKTKADKDKITVGFRSNTKQENKAEGNIKGTYGRPFPIRGKARPFLDILKNDYNRIVLDYMEAKFDKKAPKDNDENEIIEGKRIYGPKDDRRRPEKKRPRVDGY